MYDKTHPESDPIAIVCIFIHIFCASLAAIIGFIPTFALPSVMRSISPFFSDFLSVFIASSRASPIFVPEASFFDWLMLFVVVSLIISESQALSLVSGLMTNAFPEKMIYPISIFGAFERKFVRYSFAFSIREGDISSACIDCDTSRTIMRVLFGTVSMLVVCLVRWSGIRSVSEMITARKIKRQRRKKDTLPYLRMRGFRRGVPGASTRHMSMARKSPIPPTMMKKITEFCIEDSVILVKVPKIQI